MGAKKNGKEVTHPVIGKNLLASLGEQLRKSGVSGNLFVIADANIASNRVETVLRSVRDADYRAQCLSLELGEAKKTLETASEVYGWLANERAERGDTIIAFGGGVCGDLAGFVASTWKRGIGFVNLPTTVTALVDASIGGKTAVNTPHGKNLAGTFYEADLIVGDVAVIARLPRREQIAGLAEAVKHGLILDAELARLFYKHASDLLNGDLDLIAELLKRSAAVKVGVVVADRFETSGTRALLNYGHTLGHALEADGGYRRYLHGEAVAIGMGFAALMAKNTGMMAASDYEFHNELLLKIGLELNTANHEVPKLMELMYQDKKTVGGELRWVLLEKIGKARANCVVDNEVVIGALEQTIRR